MQRATGNVLNCGLYLVLYGATGTGTGTLLRYRYCTALPALAPRYCWYCSALDSKHLLQENGLAVLKIKSIGEAGFFLVNEGLAHVTQHRAHIKHRTGQINHGDGEGAVKDFF